MSAAEHQPAAAERQRERSLANRLDDAGLGRNVLVLALGLLGAAAGALVLLAGYPFGFNSDTFLGRPETIFWIALICGQTALWSVLALPVLQALRELEPQKKRTGAFLAGLLLTLAIALFAFAVRGEAFAATHGSYPLPYHGARVLILTAWAYVLALLASSAIWRIHSAVGRVSASQAPPAAEDLYRSLRLRELLNRMLSVQGAVLGAAILSTGSLRQALIAWNRYIPTWNIDHPNRPLSSAGEIPFVSVLLYGAVLSALIALVYTPTLIRVQAFGRKLRDDAAPLPSPQDPSFSDAYRRRQELEELLQLQITGPASFRAGVAILAPLASAVVSLVLAK